MAEGAKISRGNPAIFITQQNKDFVELEGGVGSAITPIKPPFIAHKAFYQYTSYCKSCDKW